MVVAQAPRTLGMLLEEFFAQHVDGKLAPKTVERYHDQAAYLDPELRAMPIAEITPLHLNREWNRLLKQWRSPPQHQAGTSALGQDGPERSGYRFQRVHARHSMGTGLGESRHQ